MSATDIAVIAIGLMVGYWIVGSFLSHFGKSEHVKQTDTTEDSHTPTDDSSSFGHKTSSWNSVLGVSEAATTDEIRRAYKLQMSQYHPDKVAALGEELKTLAERKTKEITGAYRQALKARGVSE